METITISYEDYSEFLEGYTKFRSMELDLKMLLNAATYDRYDKDVNVDGNNFRLLFKKYIENPYNVKLRNLREDYEKENK